jgi:hypothetical protein
MLFNIALEWAIKKSGIETRGTVFHKSIQVLAFADDINIIGRSLTRGPGRLLSSDLAPILQYGSRPPSDFLAKILGVDTSPFLWNTRFYFTRSYL